MNVEFPNDAISIDAWIYPESVEGFPEDVTGSVIFGGNSFKIQIQSEVLQLRLDSFEHSLVINGTTRLVPNNWYHVAMTTDGTVIKTYVNGFLDSTHVISHPVRTEDSFQIGGRFLGTIDEVRLFDRVLTPDEISDYVDSVN